VARKDPLASTTSLLLHTLHEEEHDIRARYFVSGEEFVVDARYDLVRLLGEGSFGVVALANDTLHGNLHVAIKKVLQVLCDPARARTVLRELKTLVHLKGHPCVLDIIDIIDPASKQDFDNIYIVTEYVKSDLRKIIKSDKERVAEFKQRIIREEHIVFIVFQLLCALNLFKKANILHRDLKPGNILINPDCTIRVCDFGMARAISEDNSMLKYGLTEYVVTRWYRAPEVLFNAGKYSYPIDMWAVACIMAELYNLEALFPGLDSFDQLKKIFSIVGNPTEDEFANITYAPVQRYVREHVMTSKITPKKLSKCIPSASALAIDFLEKVFVIDPEKRITVEEALKHPLFVDVYDQELVSHSMEIAPFNSEYEKMTRNLDNIRNLMLEEIVRFRPMVLKNYSLMSSSVSPSDSQGVSNSHSEAEVRRRRLHFQKSA
jgi:serine/threonine protein kinase